MCYLRMSTLWGSWLMLKKLHGCDVWCCCYQVGGLHRKGHLAFASRLAGSFGELSDQLSCERPFPQMLLLSCPSPATNTFTMLQV